MKAPRLKRERLVSLAVLMVALLCGTQALAQEDKNEARKIDEFAHAYGCDHGARLDNFAMEIEKEQQSTGYVICYGPAGEGNGSGKFRCDLSKDYLVNTRGLSPERIKTVYGGRYEDFKMSAVEFWIVPPGAEPPAPQKYEKPLPAFSGKFDERLYWDERSFDDSNGPDIGDVTFAAFADLLEQQTESVAYVVAYGTQGSATGAWRRAAKEVTDRLESDYKIAGERVKIVCGGYDAKALNDEGEDMNASGKVELWIVPKDSAPPVAEASGPEPKTEKAVQISRFYDSLLEDDAYARRAFQGFADVLRDDAGMQACIVIRPEIMNAEREAEDKRNDVKRADLFALTEKWRNELEKSGIKRDRLFIVTAEPQEFGGKIETWLVPKGAQLPDPNAFEEEQVVAEDETYQEEQPQESRQP